MMFGFWGMGWMMWIWPFLFIVFGYWLWFGVRPRRRHRRYRDDPVEHARLRLANGEITVEEFEKIKKTLENTG